jgi:DNA-binding CsgD family transcriptional regulator
MDMNQSYLVAGDEVRQTTIREFHEVSSEYGHESCAEYNIENFDKSSIVEPVMQVLLQAFERFGVGTALLGKSGRPLALNTVAEKIIRSRDGLTFSHDRRFLANHSTETSELQEEINKVIHGMDSGCNLVRISRSDRRRPTYTVTLVPLNLPMLPEEYRPYATMFIVSPERSLQISPHLIAHFFGLTPAEAKLAIAVAQGTRLSDYAEEKGVSIHTVNSQVKSVLSKTGVNRQAELVKLLLSSMLLVGGGESIGYSGRKAETHQSD